MTLKNINVAVCDDETEVLDTIKNYLISYQIQYDIECATHTFSNGSDFLESLDKIKFNIVFLDIEMPEMDGLEIAKHIREKSADDVYIIFVTSYPSYMHDSFQVQPFQYIVKPVTYDIFEKTMSDLFKHIQGRSNIRVVIDTDHEKQLVNISDIVYIRTHETQKLHLVYTLSDSQICGRGTLSSLEASLSEHGFILTNRSTLVNSGHILSFDDQSVRLDNGDVINISRRNLKSFRTFFANQIISDMKG
ncbi:MAG: LytTR family DNA-binding domain-containing protein [Clostridiales bacterium]|nr:LytTR family DNA-binding domain-containing protein [Clostridiales bacterium]